MDILLGVEMVQGNTYIYAQCQYERHPPVQNIYTLFDEMFLFLLLFRFLDVAGLDGSDRQVSRQATE